MLFAERLVVVRRDGPDLTVRQLGVYLTCYLEVDVQTVQGALPS
jgi:hypothetical protein